MEVGSVTVLAVIGVLVAVACALACAVAAAWLTRSSRATPPNYEYTPATLTTPTRLVVAPTPHASSAQPPIVIVQLQQSQMPTMTHGRRSEHDDTVVLEKRHPQLGSALGAWMQTERDPVERARIAHDLGTIGTADAARSLLDGVRTGVLSPTIAVDNLERGGFDAGIAVAAALGDPSPHVRAVATSIVGRRSPLEHARIPLLNDAPPLDDAPQLRPMPQPPRRPRGQG